MQNKNITTLRSHLFEVLEQLKEGKIDIHQARAASEVGQTIINSVKVELDFIKFTNGDDTGFITAPPTEDVKHELVATKQEVKPEVQQPVVETPKKEAVVAAEKKTKKYIADATRHEEEKQTIVRPKAQYSNRGYHSLLDEYAPQN